MTIDQLTRILMHYFFDLQFAFKGGFNVVRKLLENEELDAPVST